MSDFLSPVWSFMKYSIAFIAYGWTNPLAQDLFTQYIGASIIGAFLPSWVVSPVNSFIKAIPLIGIGVKWFENALKDDDLYYIPLENDIYRKIRWVKSSIKSIVPDSAIPKLLAGYFFTYVIGGICLALCIFFLDLNQIVEIGESVVSLIGGLF